jgi:hypothetical protein
MGNKRARGKLPDGKIIDLINFTNRPKRDPGRDSDILCLHEQGLSYAQIREELADKFPKLTRDAIIKVVKRAKKKPSLDNPSPCTITVIQIDWNTRETRIEHFPEK